MLSAGVRSLARGLAGGDDRFFDAARHVAEAQVTLHQIRQVRANAMCDALAAGHCIYLGNLASRYTAQPFARFPRPIETAESPTFAAPGGLWPGY